MTSIVQQGSSLDLGPTFPSPNPHYNSIFGSFDLVSSPVCMVEINIEISSQWELGHTSVGRVSRYTDQSGCVLVQSVEAVWHGFR